MSNWLTYSKNLLEKVSFDRKLLVKELRKSLKKLSLKDKKNLYDYAKDQFGVSMLELKKFKF